MKGGESLTFSATGKGGEKDEEEREGEREKGIGHF